MENLKIDIYKNQESIYSLGKEWSVLASDNMWPVYSCPEWYLAWWDTFGHKVKKMAIITARVDDKLVGILPICRRQTNRHGLFFHITEPISGGMPDHHCPVVAPGWESQALPVLLEKAFSYFGRTGTFIWPSIPTDNPSVAVIREWVNRNKYLSTEKKGVSPRLTLQKDYRSTEALWGKNHRTDVRRQRKRLSEIGKILLWTASTKDEMRDFLPEFFQVHTDKWHSQGFPGKLNYASIQRYYYNMVERLWDKGLHVSALMCNEERISYHFGFLSGGWLLLYTPTYRIKYENFSPSKVHLSYLVEEGIKAGWKGIDFLSGGEPYKYRWSKEELKSISFIIGFKRMSPSYLWFSKGKAFVQRKFGVFYSDLMATVERYLKVGARQKVGPHQ